MRRTSISALVLGVAFLAGCAEAKPEPQLASSSASPSYAKRYPEELSSLQEQYGDQERDAKELMGKFSSYPDELNEPNWADVEEVYQFANDEGRSADYVERLESSMAVAEFFVENDKEIGGKVAGAVRHSAKKNGCNADVAAPVGYTLNKAVTETLEDNMHEQSDAHTVIRDNEEQLGKQNVEKLEVQADEISRASYLVHVGMVRSKVRLRAMLDELKDVEKTLDRTIEDLGKELDDVDLDEKERARLEERRNAAVEAKNSLEPQVKVAQSLSEAMEQRIEETKKEHQQAFESLMKTVNEKKEQQGGEPAAEPASEPAAGGEAT